MAIVTMAEPLPVSMIIWSHPGLNYNYQDLLLQHDRQSSSLLVTQYPGLVSGSESFVGCRLPLASLQLASSRSTCLTTGLISLKITERIKSVAHVESSNSSYEEELVTLTMCCSLIDTSIPQGSHVDLVLETYGKQPSSLDDLLECLDSTTPLEKDSNTTNQTDTTSLVDANGSPQPPQSVNSSEISSPTVETSTRHDSSTKNSIAGLTVTTQLTIIEGVSTHGAEPVGKEYEARQVADFNKFAESHGAEPRASTRSVPQRESITRRSKNNSHNRTSLGLLEGGYMTDRRRDYNATEDHLDSSKGGAVAKKRNKASHKGNSRPKDHSTTKQEMYVQPFYMHNNPVIVKHGSFW